MPPTEVPTHHAILCAPLEQLHPHNAEEAGVRERPEGPDDEAGPHGWEGGLGIGPVATGVGGTTNRVNKASRVNRSQAPTIFKDDTPADLGLLRLLQRQLRWLLRWLLRWGHDLLHGDTSGGHDVRCVRPRVVRKEAEECG